MRRVTIQFGCRLLVLAGVFLGLNVQGEAREPQADSPWRLSGARAVVEAGNFESIQAAIDALPASGGIVKLPPGEFEIHQPLVLRTSDACLEGSGPATHIVNKNVDGQPAILVAHANAQTSRRDSKSELWRIRLANFRVTGNPKSGHGIEARGINEILIDGVAASHHGGDGIRLDLCYEDPRVCDSLLTYNKATGLNLLGCHDIVVSSNQIEENQDALHCSDGFNLCMSGNCVDDHLGRGVVIENTYGSVVSGNMIEECHEEAIVLDRDCYGITLSANVIAHNGGGIHLVDAHGCSVSANTFTLMKSHAIRIGPGSGRIAVGGNSFCNSYVGDGQVKRGTNDLAAAGIVLDGTSNIAISGNTFSGLTTKALVLTERPSTRILFEENLLTEVTSDHGNLPPLSSVHGFGPASASGRGGAGPPSPGLQLEMSTGGGDANAKASVVRRHGGRLTDSAARTIIEGKPGLKFDEGGIGPISPALALCALGVAFFAGITLLVLVAAILRIRYAMAIPLTGGMEASAAYPAISGAR